MKKYLPASLLIVALALCLLPSVAQAHVVVYPKQTRRGSHEKFTVRVPSEKQANTVAVKILIPPGVSILRFAPQPDWAYAVERDSQDRIAAVTWTSLGPGLGPDEFGEFHMQGEVAPDAEHLVWHAHQRYSDGSEVAWTGDHGDDTPASVTRVRAAVAGGMHAGHETAAEPAEPSPVPALPMFLSLVAVAVSLAALVMTLRPSD